jgi:hypothetical protein
VGMEVVAGYLERLFFSHFLPAESNQAHFQGISAALQAPQRSISRIAGIEVLIETRSHN